MHGKQLGQKYFASFGNIVYIKMKEFLPLKASGSLLSMCRSLFQEGLGEQKNNQEVKKLSPSDKWQKFNQAHSFPISGQKLWEDCINM